VLVGSDGSWRSGAVLDVAAAEAARRGADLAVVSAVPPVSDAGGSLTEMLVDEQRASELVDWRLAEAVARVRSRHPGLELTTHRLADAETGEPDEQVAALPEASLLVLGARGAHGEPVFALGTVSRRLLKGTTCPVLVVPEDARAPQVRQGRRPAPVTAGIDDGPLAAEVLAAAAVEAALLGTHVVAVHAYARLPGEGEPAALARARRSVAGTLRRAGATPDRPVVGGAGVSVVLTCDAAADTLLAHSRRASALVVGSRGSAALAGLSLESVSRAVLDAPPCPVLLVVPRAVPPAVGHVPRPRTEVRT
jgi:nucleotide-binding universal stress UspA family protein